MIKTTLEDLYKKGSFPGASAAKVSSEGVLEEVIIGNRSLFPEKKELVRSTYFDMASLSKILGPTMIALSLQHQKALKFSSTIGQFFPNAGPYKDTTVLELLTHQGGFSPEAPIWKEAGERENTLSYIFSLKPQYKKGTEVVYSCLGYIVLGKILECVGSDNLDALARELVWNPMGMADTTYNPKKDSIFAPTEVTYENPNKYYTGVVHDENARFMRPDLSGNAGVFSNISDMEKFVTSILREAKEPNLFTKEEFNLFLKDFTPFSPISRSIGFGLNLRGWEELAGKNASKKSFGHTGFTGTSIWIDIQKDRGAILLSNRVHPTRENKVLLELRKEFHDEVFSENS